MTTITMQYLEETYPGEDLDELKRMTKAQLIREIFVLQIQYEREQHLRMSAQDEVAALSELVKSERQKTAAMNGEK